VQQFKISAEDYEQSQFKSMRNAALLEWRELLAARGLIVREKGDRFEFV
tara:strand:- start:201 stop:347 length:147 start_codon:yes stop_codon:yes gene_type:complete